jgi:alginate O-acetyltransferase complex protein AlgJ
MPFPLSLRTRAKGGTVPTAQEPGADAATADDVIVLYEAFLGRAPRPEEIALQLAAAPSLRALLNVVTASEERQVRNLALVAAAEEAAAPLQRLVNVHTEELEPFGYAPGTWSADGVAVTGRGGWVFLGSGTNAILDQYRGAAELPPAFHERWAEAMAARRAGAEVLGAAFVGLIVPDKLPVLAGAFPEALPSAAAAPAAVLAARPELGLSYPVAELAAVAEGAYLRTDTHLTYAGNAALAAVVADAVGVAIPPTFEPLHRYVISGDLGSRFSPSIVEVVSVPSGWGNAREVESNREAIAAVGGHVGTRQVLRNDAAGDERTVVVFGDSYAFAAPNYQGLAWFLAQAFREVHFVWVPFGWDPDYAAAVGAGVVVCQGAERFVIRPPELRVDVHALAAKALARGGAAPSTAA